MRKQNKKLFDNKYQLQKIFLNADDLMLKHNIKLNNKHDLKFIFGWNELFQIQRANSIKDIYILKKMNETRLEKVYADNRLNQFKTRNVENSSTKQIEIYKILNITPKNSIDVMNKSNIINKNVRVDDKIQNKMIWNAVKSSDADSQIFRNDITNDNLLNLKTRNIHTRIKSNTRRLNRLIEIKNSLNNVERNTNTATFATIDKISIKKNEVR